jgi:hypothetical protein
MPSLVVLRVQKFMRATKKSKRSAKERDRKKCKSDPPRLARISISPINLKRSSAEERLQFRSLLGRLGDGYLRSNDVD